eukprot:944506_1
MGLNNSMSYHVINIIERWEKVDWTELLESGKLKVESLTSYTDEKSVQVDSTVQDNNIDDVVVESKTFSIADANISEREIGQIKDTTVAANTETVPPVSTTTTETVITAAVNTIPTSKKLQKAQGAPVDMGGKHNIQGKQVVVLHRGLFR